jgi:hypothetical protein
VLALPGANPIGGGAKGPGRRREVGQSFKVFKVKTGRFLSFKLKFFEI